MKLVRFVGAIIGSTIAVLAIIAFFGSFPLLALFLGLKYFEITTMVWIAVPWTLSVLGTPVVSFSIGLGLMFILDYIKEFIEVAEVEETVDDIEYDETTIEVFDFAATFEEQRRKKKKKKKKKKRRKIAAKMRQNQLSFKEEFKKELI